jgi:hypothetical protein
LQLPMYPRPIWALDVARCTPPAVPVVVGVSGRRRVGRWAGAVRCAHWAARPRVR